MVFSLINYRISVFAYIHLYTYALYTCVLQYTYDLDVSFAVIFFFLFRFVLVADLFQLLQYSKALLLILLL